MADSYEKDYLGQYFANFPKEELAHALTEKIKACDASLDQLGMRELWRMCFQAYYGRHWKGQAWRGSSLGRAGNKGEFTTATINHYRSVIKSSLTLVAGEKITWDTRPTNDDSKSVIQARLGNTILDSYMRTKHIFRNLRNCAHQTLIFSKGFNYATWNPSLGKAVGVGENGKVVREGDIEVQNISLWDYWCDSYEMEWPKRQWEIPRLFVNKYDLIAQYPDQADGICELPTMKDLSRNRIDINSSEAAQTEKVPVYHFYHKPTPACPNGRVLYFCSSDVILYDSLDAPEGSYIYQFGATDNWLPCFRMVPEEILGTTEGYSDSFDLLGPQQMIDVLYSSAYTNLSSFGTTRILVPESANIKASELAKGLTALKYNPNGGKPEVLQLAQVTPEIFKMMDKLEQVMELLSGVNSAVRGNPEPFGKGTAGTVYSLFQQMAIQYSSSFQESFVSHSEDLGTFMLKLLKKFAKNKRVVAAAGQSNVGDMVEFYAPDDLSEVDRVAIDVGNPAFSTKAGKKQFADEMLERGFVKSPQEYLAAVQTGNIEPLLRASTDGVTLIKRENEMIQKGELPSVLWTDPHIMHMREHMAQGANPSYRKNDPALKVLTEHFNMHKALVLQMNPLLTEAEIYVMITGEQIPIPPPELMMSGAIPPTGPVPPPDAAAPPMPMPEVPPAEVPLNEFEEVAVSPV